MNPHQLAHDSVVILALPLVTLTPSCLARATISILFLEETACAILHTCQISVGGCEAEKNILCGVGLVVHKEKLEVTGVVDQEGLVTGWHQMAGLPVRTVTDL